VAGEAVMRAKPDQATVRAARELWRTAVLQPERALDLKSLRLDADRAVREREFALVGEQRIERQVRKAPVREEYLPGLDRETASRMWHLAGEAHQAARRALLAARGESLHESPAARKQFVEQTLARLAPEDARHFQALTDYYLRTREDFYRVFPEIDHQRQMLEREPQQVLPDHTQSRDRGQEAARERIERAALEISTARPWAPGNDGHHTPERAHAMLASDYCARQFSRLVSGQ